MYFCIQYKYLSFKNKYTQVSKDVRKLRDFEQTLLTNYTHYLSILEETIRGNDYLIIM